MPSSIFLIVCGIWCYNYCEAQVWLKQNSNQFLNPHDLEYYDNGYHFGQNPTDPRSPTSHRYNLLPYVDSPMHRSQNGDDWLTTGDNAHKQHQMGYDPALQFPSTSTDSASSNVLGSGTHQREDSSVAGSPAFLYPNGQFEQTSNRDSLIKSELTDSLAGFTVDLMKSMAENNGGENFLFSPISIYTALALINLGSSGITNDELTAAMKLPRSLIRTPQKIHQNIGEILNSTKNSGITNGGKKVVQVEIANGLFVQKKFPIKSTYKNDAKTYYDGDVRNLDFSSGSAYEEINRWVAKKTSNQIPKIFTKPLNRNTVSVLLSAIYFNGGWLDVFRERYTKPEIFRTAFNTEIQVPMMNRQGSMFYTKNENHRFEAVQLDFHGHVYSAVFILPDPGRSLAETIATLDASTLRSTLNITTPVGVDLKMPKFSFSKSRSINEVLRTLGVVSMFDRANLDNMIDDNAEIKISEVKHAADITVDELGMKATAVTSVQVELLSAKYVPKQPIKFYLNRPFLLAIVHRPTSVVLFTAAVNDPRQGVRGSF